MSDANLPPKEGGARRLLLIQSGSRPLLERALRGLRQRDPDGRMTVLLQRGEAPLPPALLNPAGKARVEVLDNPGPSPAFLRGLRKRNFDRVYVLWTGEPGYWKLKLLPAALWPARTFAIDDQLRLFPLDASGWPAVAQHLRVRLEGPLQLGDQVARLWRRSLEAAALPATLALLASRRLASSDVDGRQAPP